MTHPARLPDGNDHGDPLRRSREAHTVPDRLAGSHEQANVANTLYDILEVIPTASPETIHAAYRSLISRYHPDKVAGLGPELQAVANARTKEINHAYDVLCDAARRASYDAELRETASSAPRRQDFAAGQRSAAPPFVHEPGGRRLLATLLAALAGAAALLALPYVAKVVLDVINFFATGHIGHFQDFEKAIDADARFSGLAYLLALWGWLFISYLFGLIAYRLSVGVGERIASDFGDLFSGTNVRIFLFLTFVCVVAGGELLFSAHTMTDILADMFALAGAYRAERGVT